MASDAPTDNRMTTDQVAQAAPGPGTNAIKVTINKDGVTTEHTLAPGQTFAIEAGSQVVIDAGGLVLEAGIDSTGSNLTFTNPDSGAVYTLGGMAANLTGATASLIAIADVLAGVSTAAGGAGGGANGGGTGNDGSVDFVDISGGDGPGDTPGTNGVAAGGTSDEPELPALPPDGAGAPVETQQDGALVDAIQDVVWRETEGPTAGNVITNDINVDSVTEVDGFDFLVGSIAPGIFGDLSLRADGAFFYDLFSGPQLPGSDFAVDIFEYTGTSADGSDTTELVVIITDGGSPNNVRLGDGTDNVLTGDGNAQLIIGGGGNDNLTGGGGNDRFGFLESTTTTDTGTDTITDFNAGDIIDISELLDAGNTTAGNIAIVNDGGGNATIIDNSTDGGGAVVAVVQGVDAANLTVDANGDIVLI